MEKIIVNVSWCDKNYGASLGENVPGAVVVTAKTYEELTEEVRESLKFHIEGMIADGDDVPQWLRDGEYEFEYHLDAAALLQMCSPYASIAAISRASGINKHQLSHYANGIKKPRPEQRRRIVEGIHKIGRELISLA
ncbi:MAG: CopG family transcriptional regulator [Prevotella sp.]|nr:CopG family transcriptional regulator [Prevotella sp.]